jgi:hypothetical protein
METAEHSLTEIIESIILIAAHPGIGRLEERYGRGVWSFPARIIKFTKAGHKVQGYSGNCGPRCRHSRRVRIWLRYVLKTLEKQDTFSFAARTNLGSPSLTLIKM